VRILIANLTRGGFSGGYIKYLRELVPRLARHPDVETFELVMPPGTHGRLGEIGAQAVEWPTGCSSVSRWLDARARALRADVVFVPTATLPTVATPVAVMVQNMEPLVRPIAGNAPIEAVRNIGRRLAAYRAVTRAKRVIAVSDYVRDFLVDTWNIPMERIGVVHHGVEAAPYSTVPHGLSAADAGQFIFTAGSIRPARGLEDVVGALERLGEAAPTVVIAGTIDARAENYARRLRESIERAGLMSRVRWVGHLDPAQMRWCFEHAAAFIMTSRVEACPNIVLEAMCYGAISVATRCRPMPEFYGKAAWYYEPGDSAALAKMLRELAVLPANDRVALQDTARRRAADFSWQATADYTVAELQRARLPRDG